MDTLNPEVKGRSNSGQGERPPHAFQALIHQICCRHGALGVKLLHVLTPLNEQRHSVHGRWELKFGNCKIDTK